MTSNEVLDGDIPHNRNVLVVDTQGMHPGSDVSELLLDHGNQGRDGDHGSLRGI